MSRYEANLAASVVSFI